MDKNLTLKNENNLFIFEREIFCTIFAAVKNNTMKQKLIIYNTLSRRKEPFEPLHAPNVGMYVCGPTVYGDPHLGHARPAITFDILRRYLKHLGYKVRYVRNITDVGHLEHDADEGEDQYQQHKIAEHKPLHIPKGIPIHFPRPHFPSVLPKPPVRTSAASSSTVIT